MADTTTARIRLALEGVSAVQQGLSSVEGKIGDLRGSVAGLAGGLSAAGFAAWIKGAIDAADETGKMAQKTGLLTKEVAGLQLAFDQGGAGDKMQATLARLAKEASNGNEAFKAMGVTVAGSDGKLKSTRVLLGEVADKFAGYRDGAEKTALAQELFGKTGADILPVLNGGAAALADYDDKAKALGLTLDDETTKAAEQFNDQMDILLQRTQGVARQIAGELMPVLSTLSAEFAQGAQAGSAMSVTGQFLSTVIETVSVVGANLSFVLQALARDGAAIYNVYADIAKLDFDGMRKGVATYKAETLAARAELDAFERRVMQSRKIADSLKGAEGLDEPRLRRLLSAGGTAAKEAAPHVEKLTGSVGRQRAAVKTLTDAEKELAEARKQDIAVGVLRNKQAEENYKAQLQAAEVESQFRQIVIDKEREWDETANEEKLKATREILEKQQKETEDFWASVDSTAHDVFVSVANEGEDAFKRIGKTLKAAVLDMLYQMTVKKWIFQISGQSSGSVGSTGSLLDSASSAYSAYTMAAGGGAGTAGAAGSMSAIGSYAGGSMSAANAYGSVYANATGTGINGLLATNGAYGTASGAAAGSSSSWLAAVGGYAALIAVAIAVANNLYEKGYNRQAVGYGDAQTVRFGRSSYTTDPNISRSAQYDTSFERMKVKTLEWAGLSEKWVDILSGTTRMAALFGRKLSEVGYQGNFQGGDVSVSGYAKYKGGLFRSNKTVNADIDPQAASQVESLMRSIQAGSKSMAAAMGLNAAAIDNYTGKLKINMKGADTAAEQSERMAKAMDNLQYSMLKAASGGKLAKEEFERMTTQARADMEAVGISASGMADIIAAGMMGRMSQSQVGEALSEMVIGGIYNMVVSPFAGQIAQAFMATIIQPMVMAVTTGGSISTAVSQASIQSVVASARVAAANLTAILSDPAFKAAMAGVQQAITGIAGASVKPAAHVRSFGSAMSGSGSAAKAAADEARRAAQAIKDTWSGITDSILEEMGRIRRAILGDTPAGSAYAQAQFAIATAQARAGNQTAAERLPDLSQALLELAESTAASAGDLRAVQGSTLASLAETRRILGARFGIALPAFDVGTNYVPRDMVAQIHKGEAIVPAAYNPAAGGIGGNGEVVAELRAMRAELADLKRSNLVAAGSATRLERIMETATNGGNITRVQVVA